METMKDIKKMSDKDLATFVEEKREAIRASRFNAAERNVKAIKNARTEIARALTELTARLTASTAQAGNKAAEVTDAK